MSNPCAADSSGGVKAPAWQAQAPIAVDGANSASVISFRLDGAASCKSWKSTSGKWGDFEDHLEDASIDWLKNEGHQNEHHQSDRAEVLLLVGNALPSCQDVPGNLRSRSN